MFTRMFLLAAGAAVCSTGALAQQWSGGGATTSACPTLSTSSLQTALQQSIAAAKLLEQQQGAPALGLGLNMWATIVAADGHVCYVTYSGLDAIQGQWLASRVISAQKAFTAVSLSLGANYGKRALSSANLYSAVQPGGSLFGLATSNPVFAPGAYGDTISTGGGTSTAAYTPGSEGVATYAGPISTANYGKPNDPMIGQIIGGINVFGGGLALYTSGGAKVGGLGVSGDTSCTDHFIAWYLRKKIGLDHLGSINGVAALPPTNDTPHPDNIIFDIPPNGVSASGYGQPSCGGVPYTTAEKVATSLPPVSSP